MYAHTHYVMLPVTHNHANTAVPVNSNILLYNQVYEDNPHINGIGEYPCSVWHPLRSTAVYITAWCVRK